MARVTICEGCRKFIYRAEQVRTVVIQREGHQPKELGTFCGSCAARIKRYVAQELPEAAKEPLEELEWGYVPGYGKIR